MKINLSADELGLFDNPFHAECPTCTWLRTCKACAPKVRAMRNEAAKRISAGLTELIGQVNPEEYCPSIEGVLDAERAWGGCDTELRTAAYEALRKAGAK